MAERYEWDGNVLGTTCVALSVHTSIVEAPGIVPELLLAAADSGTVACILAPQQLGAFLRAHSASQLVCYDVARVHWVLHEFLRSNSEAASLQSLWGFSRNCRFHDVALLDQLVHLAERGNFPPLRSLKELSLNYTKTQIVDDNELRVRSGMADGKAWEKIDPQLFTDALQAVRAILVVHRALILMSSHHATVHRIEADTIAKFGPFGMGIQVKGSIALAAAYRKGLCLGANGKEQVLEQCREARRISSAELRRHTRAKRSFQWEHGQVSVDRNGLPRVRTKTFGDWLTSILTSILGPDAVRDTVLRSNSSKRISSDPDVWGLCLRLLPELDAWSTLVEATKWVRRSLLTLGFSLGSLRSEASHERACVESPAALPTARAAEAYSGCFVVPPNSGAVGT